MRVLSKKSGLALFASILLWGCTLSAFAQSSNTDAPFIEIINEIERNTSYNFLYREALVSDLRLSINIHSGNLLEDLHSELARHRIAMRVDSSRNQIVIFKPNDNTPNGRIEVAGYVVDASTGERLPYATLYWKKDGGLKGTTANSAGHFTLSETSRDSALLVTASYVGYASRSTRIENAGDAGGVDELTIRLSPESIGGSEIIVTGQNYFASVDTLLRDYVDMGSFSPLGEPNTLRALQLLPSVSIGTAMSNGLNVRGSATDGLHVLLDGTSIFNQSHLFGLLDSFNADVLRRSGLYYDITPAQYQAPPGGTLTLFTKTGSLNRFHSSVGISNSSYRATLEGPLKKGSSSWVLSGRHSYMNSVNWLNNSDLIEWGLNIDRPREAIGANLVDVESRLVTPGAFQAGFFDAHGKLYFEGNRGNRFYLSGYYGGDDNDQSAERLIRQFDNNTGTSILAPIDVETSNRWNNLAGSAHYEHSFSPTVYSHTSASFSVYETDYSKEDFTYIQFDDDNSLREAFVYPFENRSIINEVKAEQRMDVDFNAFLWTIGGTYHYYLGEYFENSFDRPGFFIHESAHKADAYTQFDFNRWDPLRLNAGARFHYYSNGSFLRVSPRVKLELLPKQPISLSFGYSRNYKFLHQINLYNVVSADVWILSKESQPPSEVNYLTSGIYLKPGPYLYLQAEAYIKEFNNLRLHEINTQSLSNTFTEAPWFFDNDGLGQGLEVLMRNSFRGFSLTSTFTWSRMELQNDRLNNGDPFPVEWDRTYRYTVTAEVNPFRNFYLYLSWLYATGTPNQLATFGPDSVKRLDEYYRTDMSFEYKKKTEFGRMNLSLSFFNLFDRKNPWYREYSFVLDTSQPTERLRTLPVNVFDLGFQPSFEISLSF